MVMFLSPKWEPNAPELHTSVRVEAHSLGE